MNEFVSAVHHTDHLKQLKLEQNHVQRSPPVANQTTYMDIDT